MKRNKLCAKFGTQRPSLKGCTSFTGSAKEKVVESLSLYLLYVLLNISQKVDITWLSVRSTFLSCKVTRIFTKCKAISGIWLRHNCKLLLLGWFSTSDASGIICQFCQRPKLDFDLIFMFIMQFLLLFYKLIFLDLELGMSWYIFDEKKIKEKKKNKITLYWKM